MISFLKLDGELKYPWKGFSKKKDIVSAIIKTAKEEKVDLIIMGADRGKVVAEWLSADVMRKTKIPAVVIPHELKRL